VLRNQLRHRARLEAAGKINQEHVFFQETGEPIRNLQYVRAGAGFLMVA
jgi:hypothetical protein